MNAQANDFEPIGRATYSPEDNKLRLYPDARLDAPTYARMKEAGFTWGRFQQCFTAPMWTPQRYDLLVELCGEVGDEEGTLQERAEQRAERFTRYKANRHRDAHSAADRVAQLTENIPSGQPIIVGHHSQQGAERIARKINRAMETAVDQWSRHEYWTARIPAVIDHAEWKGDAKLRHRRIKSLEADERKFAKEIEAHEMWAQAWSAESLTSERAWRIADHDRSGAYSILRDKREDGTENAHLSELPAELIAKAAAHAIRTHTDGPSVTHYRRWLDHTRLRLAFEREMMERQGGDRRERFAFAVGGKVQGGRWSQPGAWHTILRVNKSADKINSLTVKNAEGTRSWQGSQSILPVEEVTAYEPPTEGEPVPKAARRKVLPLCNYPSADALSMTEAEYKAIPERHRSIDGYCPDDVPRYRNKATHRRYRAWIETPGKGWGGESKYVHISDKKTTHPPTKEPPSEPPTPEPLPERLRFDLDEAPQQRTPQPAQPQPSLFEDMAARLKAGGVQTAVAHQLYPTPREVAQRAANLADIQPGHRVLEPSAGTGALLGAMGGRMFGLGPERGSVHAVEINAALCQRLRQSYPLTRVHNIDFLEWSPNATHAYDRIVMNPPFENASDIKHVLHALAFLKDGGRLVGICADGPRQNDKIQPLCTSWEQLPAGTFAGTNVRTVLFTIDK